MATEYPPLNRIHIVGYSANDQDYPILNLVADPRVAGYKVPEDLSACPDKRYPNHVFTGAQPISGDQRVRHVWEILPSPWVPFTRYDDDLGPIQGRRRSVKNEGQKASLTSSTRTTYEGREGSSIVLNEAEETWSISVDEDGNSLFPIKERDFYDPLKGAVKERRQLIVPTGEEKATLENVGGIITQTSYEFYNEYLSYKVTQTYIVDGPQLVGQQTNNEGQLATVTTQRKASDNYSVTQPTATRTVEVSREDAESLIERVIDIPEVFAGKTFSKEGIDPVPAKFRVASPTITEEQTVEGTAAEPSLATGDIAKSEQQVTKFVKRLRSTFRDILGLPKTLTQLETNNEQQLVTVSETLRVGSPEIPLDSFGNPIGSPISAKRSIQTEALGDGTYIVTTKTIPKIFDEKNKVLRQTTQLPQKFISSQTVSGQIVETTSTLGTDKEPDPIGTKGSGVIESSVQRVTEFKARKSKTEVNAVSSLSGKVWTTELGGGIADVTETTNSALVKSEYGTISIEREAISPEVSITRSVKLENPPILRGQEYDDVLDVELPFTEQFVNTLTISPNGVSNSSINPRDVHHAQKRTFDIDLARRKYLDIFYEIDEVINISLPDSLAGVDVYTEEIKGGENAFSTGNSCTATATAIADYDVAVGFNVRNGYSGPAPSKKYTFFIDPQEQTAKGRLTQIAGDFKDYPIFQTESFNFAIITKSERNSGTVTISLPNNKSQSFSQNRSSNIQSFNVPPTLHPQINIGSNISTHFGTQIVIPQNKSHEVQRTATASGSKIGSVTANVVAKASFEYAGLGIIPATKPERIDTGKFLYQINSQLYRFGLVRVEATIVEITPEMAS